MGIQEYYKLVKWLDTDSLRGALREYLSQSLLACEAGNLKLMRDLAEAAHQAAVTDGDQMGEAASLIHLGVTYAQTGSFDQAKEALERAGRIYHGDPAHRQGYNEGIAAFGLGLVYEQRNRPLANSRSDTAYDYQVKSISHYQRALKLFAQAKREYAAQGDEKRFRDVQTIGEKIQERITSQTPTVYIDGETYRAVSPIGQDEELAGWQAGGDYQLVAIGEDESQALDWQFGDYLLVRWVTETKDIQSGPGVYKHVDEYEPGQFERDDRGNLWFLGPNTKHKLIGAEDEPQVGRVEAVLFKIIE